MRNVTRRAALALAGGLFALAQAAHAQTNYPSKPVELIVPYNAGASNDLAARIIAAYLEPVWKVPVRVINKPGGNTVPAASEVMQSSPDGYSIYVDGLGQSAMLELVVKNPPFKVLDRTFLGTIGEGTMMVIVPATSPYKTLREAVDAWKANPATFTWGSAGGNSALDLGARRIAYSAKIPISQTKPINHRGGAEVTTRIAGGHVDFGLGSWATVGSYHASGNIRVLSVSSPKRLPMLPDVPTNAEAGFPDTEIFNWIGLSGPPNMPANVVAAWEKVLKEMSEDKGVLEKLKNIGVVPFYNGAKATREIVMKDQKVVAELWPEMSK